LLWHCGFLLRKARRSRQFALVLPLFNGSGEIGEYRYHPNKQ
jgi:hypothetical protein